MEMLQFLLRSDTHLREKGLEQFVHDQDVLDITLMQPFHSSSSTKSV
jgi:hypothetical protein